MTRDGCLVNCAVKNSVEPASDAGVLEKIRYGVLCPPHGLLERCLSAVLLFLLSWAVPWSILGDECMPGSNIFSLIILIDVCILGGLLVSIIKIPYLPPLPPLLGMLIAGFCLRNIPYIDVAKDIDPDWSTALRSIALSLILVKAGLELDASALKKMKGVCIRLTTIPCLVETVTCAITCRYLLGFPWEWGFILGFVLGAVTPAVIVPSMLSLQQDGYGSKKGIPTLVIAASSFDDVLAISGFSVVLGIAFSQVPQSVDSTSSWNETSNVSTTASSVTDTQSTGDLVWTIFRGPVEMIGGVLIGVLIGVILWFLPSRNIVQTTRDRSIFVVSFGIFVLFGSRRAGFPGAGALAAIVLAFVAAISWKKNKDEVSRYVGILWDMFEPVMFGLIGAEISIEKLDSNTVGLGIAVLFIGLTTRSVASFASVTCSNFSLKEKIFICFAWLPKATVQAAIGPLALDTARQLSAPDEIKDLAKQVLTIAVLSILITAPLGATAIGLSGPKLLTKSVASKEIELSEHVDEEMVELNRKNRLSDVDSSDCESNSKNTKNE